MGKNEPVDPDGAYHRLARLVAKNICVPMTLMILSEAQGGAVIAHGLPEGVRDLSTRFNSLHHRVQQAGWFAVASARGADLPAEWGFSGESAISILGVIIRDDEGGVLGTLAAIDDQPRGWTEDDRLLLEDYAALVAREIALTTEVRSRRDAEEKCALVARELAHRIKNSFAVISSLISLSARGHPEAQQFASTVSDRIQALGRANDFIQSDMPGDAAGTQEGMLQGMLKALMTPYQDGEKRISITGCDVSIGPMSITTLALMFHELATNAVKYGALSASGGRVDITCAKQPTHIVLMWVERGGPPILVSPSEQGFGTILFQRAAKRQLEADVTYDWDRLGVQVKMIIPLDRLNS